MRVSNLLALALLVLLLTLALPALAQTDSDQSSDSSPSWNSTTSQQDRSGNVNPTSVTRSHQESEGKTLDVQTLTTRDVNGDSQVYGQTETETVKLNDSTTRVTTRHYVTNADGRKVVNSVTTEEKRTLPDGAQSVVRTISSPNADGSLQVTRREMQQTVQNSPDVRTINTTVLMPGANGSLAPSTEIHEVRKTLQPGTTEYTKSVSFQDGAGNWQVNEVRQGTIEKSGDTETKRESVSRLNPDGKMALTERTVSQETSNAGEKHKQVQKFSTSMGGVTAYADGQMHLDSQVTTVTSTGPGGQQITTETVDQRSQAAPDAPLRPTQRVLDITRTNLDGVKQQTESIQSADPNGGMGVVWVDTKQTSGSGPVQVDTKKAAPEKPATPPPQ